jgi:pimeloyl-ACP methyl ester carboxylesterase
MVKIFQSNKRTLSWKQYGISHGEPVFYFHGIPGSSFEASLADEIASNLRINLIALDRPGYGDSQRQPSLPLFQWPEIVSQLADSLKIEKFSVIGFSGGGPYALACASRLGSRVKRTILVGSIAPFESAAMQVRVNSDFKPLYELAKVDPVAAQEQITVMASSPEALMSMLQSILPQSDQSIFEQNQFQQGYLENLTQALVSGVGGIVDDLHRVTNAWHFDLADIKTPVNIWHGRDDNNVGYAVAEYLASKLSKTSLHLLDNAGHFFMFNSWPQILDRLGASE